MGVNSSHNNHSYLPARLHSGFSQEVTASNAQGINSTHLSSQQRRQFLIEKVIISVFLAFIALGIIVGIVALAMLNIMPISLPIFVVSGVLLLTGLLGLGIFYIYRVSCVYRKTLAEITSSGEACSLKYRLLDQQDLIDIYSQVIDCSHVEKYKMSQKFATSFYYNKQKFKGYLKSFLSNLYLETCYLFHRIYPEETQEDINKKAINFLKSLSDSQTKEEQICFLNSIISDNVLGLELSSLLGNHPIFSRGALSYVLENIIVKGLNSSNQEEYKDILIGFGSRILSFWSASPNWEASAVPHALKIVLLAAKYDNALNQQIMSPLPNHDITLWQSILRSGNQQAMEIFLFEYGVLNCNENGDSALMVAIKEGMDISLISFLLDKGCDVLIESKNNEGCTILDLLPKYLEKSSRQDVKELLKIIVRKGLSVREMTGEFQVKLLVLSLQLDLGLEFLKELNKLKVDLWAYSNSIGTLCNFALLHKNYDVAKLCLENSSPESSKLVINAVNDKSVLIPFLESPNFDESLFKLMVFQGLSLDLPVTKNGGNILAYLAFNGKLELLVNLLKLFAFDEDTPFNESQKKLKQQLKVSVNSLDQQGNSLLHYLGSSLVLDNTSNFLEELVILLMVTSYGFNQWGAINSERRSILVNAMINKKFALVSLLLNFMTPSDINAGAKGESIHEHNYPFFLWMMYYFGMPGTEAMMEKMIRKGLNLNLVLTPANKTIKDICLEWKLTKVIAFLKKIHVWKNMISKKSL